MAKMFGGKETRGEEMAEAKAVKSGRVSPAEYARREKAEGDPESKGKLKARGQAMASGKMSAEKYASMDHKKMSNGGKVQKYADGGSVRAAMKYGPGAKC